MKKIRKVGRTQPRGSVDFYKENVDLFSKLQNGETIDVPDEVFPLLKGVVETGEERINDTSTYSKPRSKKTTSSKTITENYIEANRPDRQVPEDDDLVIKHNEDIKIKDEKED